MKKRSLYLLFGLILTLVQFSCNNESDVTYELQTLPKEVLTRETFSLEVSPATAGWTFSSKNSNIASVSDSGVVTTHYVGTTMVYVRHAASGFVDSVQVTVKPRVNFYQEPYLTFYTTQEAVKNHETGTYNELNFEDGTSSLTYRREYGIGYSGNLIYNFNPTGEYYYSLFVFNSASRDDVVAQVSERYLFVREKKYETKYEIDAEIRTTGYVDRHYVSPDSSRIITLTQISERNLLWVYYHPYTVQAMKAILNDTVGRVFDL